ncbi:hypothetical protein Tco_0199097 [Tanacetum coccineum]
MDPTVNTLSNERFVLRRVGIDVMSLMREIRFDALYSFQWFSRELYVTKDDSNDGVEFEEEEPQEEDEEEDMEEDIEEEENEPKLIFPYVEANPLNPPPPASDSEFEDVVEVEDMVEHEDETVSNSLHEVGESSTATFLQEDGDSLLPSFMRRDINSIFGRIASLTRRVVGEREAVLEDIIKEFGNAEERVECKKLKKEMEDARLSNTLLRMQKEQVERDLYWTRV